MKILQNIVQKLKIKETIGSLDIKIGDLFIDSRYITKQSLFIAYKGIITDGHHFIDNAIKKGCTAVICEKFPMDIKNNITYVLVENSKKTLGIISNEFYDYPSKKIKLIGIVGTNGKTTTTNLLFQIFKELGYKVGMISTICNKINNINKDSTHTTPDVISITKLLYEMLKHGCEYCFMEVSSHALDQDRVEGLHFDGAVFLNITHDHLDYHKTFNDYLKAKKSLFDKLNSNAFAVYNYDDKNSNIIIQNTRAKKYSFSIQSKADFNAKLIHNTLEGIELEISGHKVWVRLIGSFNIYNILAAYSIACILGQDKEQSLLSLSKVTSPKGRFEFINNDKNIYPIVDYAHTPDAVNNVLSTINIIKKKNSNVITVIGCGGNRDKDKRSIMGKTVVKKSQKVIFTSDNPRNEDPNKIIEEMRSNLSPYEKNNVITILDRREAIRTAMSLAQPKDIILILGKGHEQYQEVDDKKLPFDDSKEIKKILNMTNGLEN